MKTYLWQTLVEGTSQVARWRDVIFEGESAENLAPDDFVNVEHVQHRCDLTLGGSWDLVSTVITTLIGVIRSYNYSYLIYNPSY